MSDTWFRAELIPTAGIKGAQEQERRATSALLAVMSAVNEFGRAVTKSLGAPAGKLEAFIEVPFQLDGKRWTPDGLIRVTRGRSSWTMLVETKTGEHELSATQVEAYLDIARQEGFDGLVTISNQVPPMADVHPTLIDKRKLRGNIQLRHLSWTSILTEAVIQKSHRGVADPDQAWILGELIRYLEHPRSGVVEFADMGESWTAVRDAIRAGTLRANDRGAAEVANRWDQLVQYASLYLGRQLGADVQPVLSRKEREDLAFRAQTLRQSLEARGVLEGGLRIPGTVAPVQLRADLRARQLTVSVQVDAPRAGRPRTRVNWLLRQISEAPADLRIDAEVLHGRGVSTSALLGAVRANPDLLVIDPRKELKSFTVALVAPMGPNRARGRGSFVDSVLDAIDGFYASVVQNLKEWSAPPPQLRARPESADGDSPPDNGHIEPILSTTAEPSVEVPSPAEAAPLAPSRLFGGIGTSYSESPEGKNGASLGAASDHALPAMSDVADADEVWPSSGVSSPANER